MPTPSPRVAFFTDSYLEANGVARTSNALEAFAATRRRPLLLVHGSPTTTTVEAGSVTRLALARAALTSLRLEHDLRYDVALWRHLGRVAAALRAFQPEVVHVTGPSDIGQIGVFLARRMGIPLVASWHTNVHEYAARRLAPYLAAWHVPARARLGAWVERRTLGTVLPFYRLARVILAPNAEWLAVARDQLHKPAFLMTRGVDTDAFSPARRTRADGVLRVGYVGRLSTEKSVRELARLERALVAAGAPRFEITIVGDGAERDWLRAHLGHGALLGTLRGPALAEAYANLDVFAFPSVTETVGNVVLEAMASGVPVVAMDAGGPRSIAAHTEGAILAATHDDWVRRTVAVALDADRRGLMGAAARQTALERSWSAVFDTVYQAYAVALEPQRDGIWKAGSPGLPVPAVRERAAS